MEEFQQCLALKMMNNLLTREEICAICLGLKRIDGFKVKNIHLRTTLYKQLKLFTSRLEPLDDFFIVTLLTTLSKGNLVFNDNKETVSEVLHAMEFQLDRLRLDTAVKLLTFPLTLGFSSSKIEQHVFERVKQKENLEPWDMLQLCSYISRQGSDDLPIHEMLSRLDQRLDRLRDRDDLLDILSCYSYLSHKSVFSDKFNKIIFEEINSVPSEMFSKGSDTGALAEVIAGKLMERLAIPNEVTRGTSKHRNDHKTTSILTRLPAFISSCWALESGGSEGSTLPRLDPAKTHFLCRSQHRDLPMQLFVPQMDIGSLDKRSRQIVLCHRALSKFMGTEKYVGVSRILPHFSEPDLVFGNIGGEYLSHPGSGSELLLQGFVSPSRTT